MASGSITINAAPPFHESVWLQIDADSVHTGPPSDQVEKWWRCERGHELDTLGLRIIHKTHTMNFCAVCFVRHDALVVARPFYPAMRKKP